MTDCEKAFNITQDPSTQLQLKLQAIKFVIPNTGQIHLY